MKKLIILLFIVFLTGCDVEYNLNFEDTSLIENIQITLPKSEKTKIKDLKNSSAYAIYDGLGSSSYNVDFSSKITKFVAKYEHVYSTKNFGRALYINQCFDIVGFAENEGKYFLTTSKGFNCMLFNYYPVDNVKIVLKSNRIILENNADYKKGNKLIWEINDDNASTKEIKVVFGEVKKWNLTDFIYNNLAEIILIGGAIIIISLGTVYVIYQNKKNNKL